MPSGRVLAGAEAAGVLVYDGRSLAPLHDELSSGHITALAGSDNAVWAGVLGKGLRELRGGELRVIDGLPDAHVLSLAVHADTVYAGTALGTAAVRNARVERVYAEDLFARSLIAGNDELTVGTLEQGVATVPLRSGRGRSWDVPGSANALLSANGKLMSVGSDGVFDVASGERLYAASGAVLSDRNVSTLAEDREGRLWVGYFDRGLDIIESAGRARHIEDEHLFCINRIVHAQDYTAVATANGLVLLDREGRRRQVLGRNEGLLANHVTDVAVRDDELVAATPAGLTFIGRNAPRSLYAFHGLVNNHVYSVATAEGALVAGTLGGASLLRGDIVQASYTTANSRLPQNWITSVARVAGEWWLGTYGEGVLKLDGQGRISSFPDMPRAVVNPNAMLAWNDRVYAGTLSDGLLVYSEGRWRNASAGLPSVNVTAVAPCGSSVCVGTDNGLVRLR
jgi:ligand-binding sensor domain-containing protein